MADKIYYRAGLLLSCTFLFGAVACNKDTESDIYTSEPEKIPIQIAMDVRTRVTDFGYEQGDRIGLYVVNYKGETADSLQLDGNHVDNMCFTFQNNEWTPDEEIFWKDQTTPADVYAYYPADSIADIKAHPFRVLTDQSSAENYAASEFLWGKSGGVKPSAEAVPLMTYHSFCNLLVYLKPGKGFTEESLAAVRKDVRICNVRCEASVDLTTGEAIAKGGVDVVVPKNEGNYYRALIVPQTVADGTKLITITVEGVEYSFNRGFTFQANHQYMFTLTVNKISSGISIGVGSWQNGGAFEGDAE